jgi:hypothetical protein
MSDSVKKMLADALATSPIQPMSIFQIDVQKIAAYIRSKGWHMTGDFAPRDTECSMAFQRGEHKITVRFTPDMIKGPKHEDVANDAVKEAGF